MRRTESRRISSRLIHPASITLQLMPRPLEDGCMPEDSRGDSTTLTLSVHRRVEAVKTLLGKRLVRVTLAKSVIDFVVTSAAAQEYWLKELQRQETMSPPLSPTSPTSPSSTSSTPRQSVAHVSSSMVRGLLARRDREIGSSQRSSSTPVTVTTTTVATSLLATPVVPASYDGKGMAFFRGADGRAFARARTTDL